MILNLSSPSRGHTRKERVWTMSWGSPLRIRSPPRPQDSDPAGGSLSCEPQPSDRCASSHLGRYCCSSKCGIHWSEESSARSCGNGVVRCLPSAHGKTRYKENGRDGKSAKKSGTLSYLRRRKCWTWQSGENCPIKKCGSGFVRFSKIE